MRFLKWQYEAELIKKGYRESTIKAYSKTLEEYEKWYNKNIPKGKKNKIGLGIKYLKHIQQKSKNPNTVNGAIHPLKIYYGLFHKENPFKYIHFKRRPINTKNNFLDKEELHHIYESFPEETLTDIRDKVLLGLYIFQGVKSGELKHIRINDIDLRNYKIRIEGDGRTNSRSLPLHIKQIVLMSQYVLTKREELNESPNTEMLIITSKQSNCTIAIIENLGRKVRRRIRYFENFHQIRNSVIAIWVREKNLRIAQYLSGHRYISSTEKYKVKDLEGLKKEVEEFFPII